MSTILKASKPLSVDLKSVLKSVRKSCADLWKPGKVNHRHFTDHGPKHSESIIRHLNLWLDRCAGRLEAQEHFVLLAAIYLHDVGMQCTNRTMLSDLAEATTAELAEAQFSLGLLGKIRKHHARLSFEMITDAMKPTGQRVDAALAIGSVAQEYKHLFETVAHICNAHTGDEIPPVLQANQKTPQGAIRTRLLAAMLRVGDALDADAARINYDYADTKWDSFPAIDRFHLLKHFYVADISMKEVGRFSFTVSVPKVTEDKYPGISKDVADCAQGPLRLHNRADTGTLLRMGNFSFEDCADHESQDSQPARFEINAEVREFFATEAQKYRDRLTSTETGSEPKMQKRKPRTTPKSDPARSEDPQARRHARIKRIIPDAPPLSDIDRCDDKRNHPYPCELRSSAILLAAEMTQATTAMRATHMVCDWLSKLIALATEYQDTEVADVDVVRSRLIGRFKSMADKEGLLFQGFESFELDDRNLNAFLAKRTSRLAPQLHSRFNDAWCVVKSVLLDKTKREKVAKRTLDLDVAMSDLASDIGPVLHSVLQSLLTHRDNDLRAGMVNAFGAFAPANIRQHVGKAIAALPHNRPERVDLEVWSGEAR